MKILLILVVILLTLYAFRTAFMKVDFKQNPAGGIQFKSADWSAAVQQAKAENKPILLDIYALSIALLHHWAFADKQAGDYFNQHFINVALDGEQPEGAQLARQFQIRGYPTLIILSPAGEVRHKSAGYVDADDLIALGKQYGPASN